MADRLIYLPLGGAGEIGMNAYVYGWGAPGRERLILVDLGIGFPDMDGTPGVDVILPDLSYLTDNLDRLEAVFVTHAHEDHVGGVGRMWHLLKKPVHCRRFTANIARRKMEDSGADLDMLHEAAPFPAMVEAGPFRVGFLPVSHSIPENSALVIDTPGGRVIHSGDFKVDLTPGVGEPFDADLIREAAKPGVKALICDSTNVFNHHEGRSEALVGPNIRELVAGASGMVAATTFASNVARLRSLAEAGRDAGRSICLMGRAMKRMTEAAVQSGVLTDFPETVSPDEAQDIPRGNLMLIVTGSQGERRAASAQLSNGKYFGFEMAEGDTFLFSSKTIPGNEREVARIVNAFSEMGVDVVTEEDGLYHVSGHANRPDLVTMHGLVDPQMVIPNHGEHRHLRAHAKLAEELGRTSVIAPNGAMVDLSGNRPEIVERIETGRVYQDGRVLVGQFDGVVRDRMRMALNGLVVVSVLVEEDEVLDEPWVELRGLPEAGEGGAAVGPAVEEELGKALGRVDRRTADDDDKLEGLVVKRVRQVVQDLTGKRPEVAVLITRLTAD